MPEEFKSYADKWRPEIEKAIERQLADEGAVSPELGRAMRYAVLGGGKRIRALLVLISARACGEREEKALSAATAVECLHAYSLVHDDLPAMDDDDLRRGRPTCHREFGEAMAILAGDALLTRSLEILAVSYHDDVAVSLVKVLARAAGAVGMVGGQALDVVAEEREFASEAAQEMVRLIHDNKTAALIEASAEMGAVIGHASREDREALADFGRLVGLAFQAVDDVLDETSSTEDMGKATGKDRESGKLTLPVAISLDAARKEAGRLSNEALGSLSRLGEKGRLAASLARYLLKRKY